MLILLSEDDDCSMMMKTKLLMSCSVQSTRTTVLMRRVPMVNEALHVHATQMDMLLFNCSAHFTHIQVTGEKGQGNYRCSQLQFRLSQIHQQCHHCRV